ncbi:MAG TPA: septum site-determining protein MinC [Candidatus Deferrimicrobium sp.]|nr:septum site-determining protein MinC [Candidatus Deferrimicrobium sp.]
MKNDSVVIKGSREGIFLHLDPATDFSTLKQHVSLKLSASEKFLAGAQVICDFGSREVSTEEITELEGLFKQHNLQLKRVNTSRPSQSTGMGRKERNMLPQADGNIGTKIHPYADEQTLLIQRTLRSGQSVVYDGNVVILGDVNPGAEIVATANVIVMGALRGVVHAGATGNTESVVTAFRLKPTQLRIADQITRAPDDDLDDSNIPEIARIKDGMVTIEPYIPNERQTRAR